ESDALSIEPRAPVQQNVRERAPSRKGQRATYWRPSAFDRHFSHKYHLVAKQNLGDGWNVRDLALYLVRSPLNAHPPL
ncbi:MAG: hypothetical protein ACRDGS_06850, partial [Chloroflexota bacterium]